MIYNSKSFKNINLLVFISEKNLNKTQTLNNVYNRIYIILLHN
jgi:hypothetical protein